MTIRKITVGEFGALKRLFPDDDALWVKYSAMREKQFEADEISVYVIEDNGVFVGEITVNYISRTLSAETVPGIRVYFEAFRLDESYRGRGLGQKLLGYAVSDLQKRGFSEFTIGVEEDNEAARHIYFKFGFTEAIDYGKGDEFDTSEYTLYLKRQNVSTYE